MSIYIEYLLYYFCVRVKEWYEIQAECEAGI